MALSLVVVPLRGPSRSDRDVLRDVEGEVDRAAAAVSWPALTTVAQPNEAVGAERGVLMTIENDELVPRAVHGEGFRISTRVRDRVIRDKASVLVRDTTLDEAFKTAKSISEQNIRTICAADPRFAEYYQEVP